jgi:hypothetical protein
MGKDSCDVSIQHKLPKYCIEEMIQWDGCIFVMITQRKKYEKFVAHF